ncbi:acidPPc domain-containing protein/PAP2 family protein [Helicobacter bizzozeronii]|uniref:phosphatase PAP2 family protein n=1 Tax=Helicobacter bizzozeronii TaxID=56877 RepID=UPI00244D91DB|nr:phosphatase PAP2 family protein [Helicobacter bizzozeronii]GMB92536.1 acidPPc domain-containing protein/PAP2 family protein [Helicobacter bizzozeronii]
MLKKVVRVGCALLLCVRLGQAESQEAKILEDIGDVLRLMPIFVGVVSLGMRDYRGMAELAVGSFVTQGVIYGVKEIFASAHARGAKVPFAKRPCCDSWRGMPSGHAGGAWSAAGFVFYRYGWKPALPVIALAMLTDASRVVARKHTILQVVVGSLIGWGFAYLFTSKYRRNWELYPEISINEKGNARYGMAFHYRF